jgi:uncharacterized protein (DUF2461 family)
MDANRERYQAHIVAPLRTLLERLMSPALAIHDGFDVSGRTGENFSRINRDIRFAKDKTPYRTQMYLTFADGRSKGWQRGQLYVGISGDTVTAGFRVYADSGGKTSSLMLLAVPRVQKSPDWVKRQARRLGRKYDSYWYSMEKGEWTKNDGWPTAVEDWKRLKGWIVRKKMKPAAALRPAFPAEAARIFRELSPLYHFSCSPTWKG